MRATETRGSGMQVGVLDQQTLGGGGGIEVMVSEIRVMPLIPAANHLPFSSRAAASCTAS